VSAVTDLEVFLAGWVFGVAGMGCVWLRAWVQKRDKEEGS